jgi:tetratricopeptide (TPR) repeat protein
VSLIVLSQCVAFEPSLRGPAAWLHIDDLDNFVEHPIIARVAAEGLSLRALCAIWLPQHVVLGVWEPIAMLLKVLIACTCGLESALPFVRVSIALHCVNVVCAYALGCRALALLRLRGVPGLPRGLGEDHRPVCAAALFVGISPMCVESIAWASGQPYVLAASFALLHLHLHIESYHAERAQKRPRARGALLAFCAAGLSKAAALTCFVVPAALDLLVWLSNDGRWLRLLPAIGDGDGGDEPAQQEALTEAEAAEEAEEEEEESELSRRALLLRARDRPRWQLGGVRGGPDETALLEAFEFLIGRHSGALLCSAAGVVGASLATAGMHGRSMGLLERVLRACHMCVAYPLCFFALPASATSVRLHAPSRIEPTSARFGLPLVVVLVVIKACTVGIGRYGSLIQRHVLAARKAAADGEPGALRATALPPPYPYVTWVVVTLTYAALLLPTLGLFGLGRTGSHIVMVRADRYAYLPALLLGVPALAALLLALPGTSALFVEARAGVPTEAARRAGALVAARERALDALRLELRGLGVPHDDLRARLGSLDAHVPPFARLPPAAGADRVELRAAAPAAEGELPSHPSQPLSPPAPPAPRRVQPFRAWQLLACTLLALGCALRLRESRALCAAWASPRELYRHILALEPSDAPMLVALSTVTMGLAEPDALERAEALLREAVAHEPESGTAYNQLGLVLKNSARAPQAEEAFTRAIELAPREGSAYVNLGNVLLDGRRELGRAVELLSTGVALLPRNAPALNSLAVALKLLGHFDEAMAAYARAIELRPAHAALRHNLGLLHLQRVMDPRTPPGMVAEACARASEQFGTTLRLQPSHAGAQQSLASLARTQCGQGPPSG